MAKRPTLSDITTGHGTTTKLNANFDAIEQAFDNTLSRDGSSPNAMQADLDMNSNQILNLPDATTSSEPLTLRQYLAGATGTVNGFRKESQVATAGQTVFTATTVQWVPGVDNLVVFLDGVMQGSGNYSINTSTQITFSAGVPLNTRVDFLVMNIAGTIASTTTDAGLVTYQPAGTTNVTNVESKLREFVSVKDFGAVGDGVADDTAAIQAALNAASAVFVPEGTFLCGDLILNANNTLFGTGVSSCLKRVSLLTTPAWITGTDVSNVLIENIRFDGDSLSGNTGDTLRLITGNADKNLAVRGCYFEGTGNGCVVVLGDWDGIQITNNWFNYTDNTNANQVAVNIEWYSTPTKYPKNFVVANNVLYRGYYGVYCGGAMNGTVCANTINEVRFPVLLYAGDGNVSAVSPLENIVVSANIITNSIDSAIRIDGKAGLNNTIQTGAYRVNVIANQIYNPGNVGILAINGINYCQFSNNSIYSAGDDGIKIERVYADSMWNCAYNVVSGNTIVSSAARGIDLRAYVSWTLVEGNTVHASTGANIYIPDTTNTYNQLLNNIVTGSGTSEIIDAGANTTIVRNFGYLTQAQGSASGSGTSFTVSHGLVDTPTVVLVTSTNATPEAISVTAKTSTTFTVTFAAGGAHTLDWQASV